LFSQSASKACTTLTTTGGSPLFLKKLLIEWRIEDKGTTGKEIALGRDYLPLDLQTDDYGLNIFEHSS